jgi:DNA replicative helicase MCM subunit Mcm2 (Cdc46/Mcm family)
VPAGRDLVLRAGGVTLDDHHVVLIDELSLVQVEAEATPRTP